MLACHPYEERSRSLLKMISEADIVLDRDVKNIYFRICIGCKYASVLEVNCLGIRNEAL